jgi:hypothetical protein
LFRDVALQLGGDPFALAALSHLCALTAPYFGSRPKVSKGLAPPGALRCASGTLATVSLQGIAIYALQATLRFATSAGAEGAARSPFRNTFTRPFWLTGRVDQGQKQIKSRSRTDQKRIRCRSGAPLVWVEMSLSGGRGLRGGQARGSRGMFRARSAMMLRWISLLPPYTVSARLNRNRACNRLS